MVREPTMKPTPASFRAFRLAVDSMPAPGDYDQGLDLGGLAELFNDTDDRGGLGPVALPATDSQGEAGPVDQQPDDDLGVDPSLFGVADLAQLVLLLGVEVERGDARRHSDTSPAAMACFRAAALMAWR